MYAFKLIFGFISQSISIKSGWNCGHFAELLDFDEVLSLIWSRRREIWNQSVRKEKNKKKALHFANSNGNGWSCSKVSLSNWSCFEKCCAIWKEVSFHYVERIHWIYVDHFHAFYLSEVRKSTQRIHNFDHCWNLKLHSLQHRRDNKFRTFIHSWLSWHHCNSHFIHCFGRIIRQACLCAWWCGGVVCHGRCPNTSSQLGMSVRWWDVRRIKVRRAVFQECLHGCVVVGLWRVEVRTVKCVCVALGCLKSRNESNQAWCLHVWCYCWAL